MIEHKLLSTGMKGSQGPEHNTQGPNTRTLGPLRGSGPLKGPRVPRVLDLRLLRVLDPRVLDPWVQVFGTLQGSRTLEKYEFFKGPWGPGPLDRTLEGSRTLGP